MGKLKNFISKYVNQSSPRSSPIQILWGWIGLLVIVLSFVTGRAYGAVVPPNIGDYYVPGERLQGDELLTKKLQTYFKSKRTSRVTKMEMATDLAYNSSDIWVYECIASDAVTIANVDWSKFYKESEVSFADIYGISEGCYPIVAPVSQFMFVNSNAESPTCIEISHVFANATYIIQFNACVTWYTEGLVGAYLGDTTFETIAGNHPNANEQGGVSGLIIGYASPQTKVRVYKVEGNKRMLLLFEDYFENAS